MGQVTQASVSCTLRSLASELGVSRMSVSRALRDDPGVQPEIRARVLALAKARGYRRNAHFSLAMAAVRRGHPVGHRPTLALVTAWLPRTEHTLPPVYRLIQEGVLERAESLGLDVDHFTVANNEAAANLGRILKNRGIETAVILPLFGQYVDRINLGEAAGVRIAYSASVLPIPMVSHDHAQGTRLCLRHAYQAGFRRPALCLSPWADTRSAGEWRAGYSLGMEAYPDWRPIPPGIFEVKNGEWDWEAFGPWYKKHRPDLLITLVGLLERPGAWPFTSKQPTLYDLDWRTGTGFAGVDQQMHIVGAVAVDHVLHAAVGYKSSGANLTMRTLVPGIWCQT